MTKDMERVLGIAIDEGYVCAGTYITKGNRKMKSISASTLRALASRGLLALGISPDGGIVGRPTDVAQALMRKGE